MARWSGAELSGLLQRPPAIAAAVLPVVLERRRAAQDLCRELATERVERRLARAVLRCCATSRREAADFAPARRRAVAS